MSCTLEKLSYPELKIKICSILHQSGNLTFLIILHPQSVCCIDLCRRRCTDWHLQSCRLLSSSTITVGLENSLVDTVYGHQGLRVVEVEVYNHVDLHCVSRCRKSLSSLSLRSISRHRLLHLMYFGASSPISLCFFRFAVRHCRKHKPLFKPLDCLHELRAVLIVQWATILGKISARESLVSLENFARLISLNTRL